MRLLSEKIEAEMKRRNLTGRMREAQWMALLTHLQTELIEARIKWLFKAQPGDWTGLILLPVEGYLNDTQFGTISLSEVEWLELKSDDPGALESQLQAMHVPYSLEGEYLRVWGYSPAGMGQANPSA
jgi:hypothetical protein